MINLLDVPRDILKEICINISRRCVASFFNLTLTNKKLNGIIRSLIGDKINNNINKMIEWDYIRRKYRNKRPLPFRTYNGLSQLLRDDCTCYYCCNNRGISTLVALVSTEKEMIKKYVSTKSTRYSQSFKPIFPKHNKHNRKN